LILFDSFFELRGTVIRGTGRKVRTTQLIVAVAVAVEAVVAV